MFFLRYNDIWNDYNGIINHNNDILFRDNDILYWNNDVIYRDNDIFFCVCHLRGSVINFFYIFLSIGFPSDNNRAADNDYNFNININFNFYNDNDNAKTWWWWWLRINTLILHSYEVNFISFILDFFRIEIYSLVIWVFETRHKCNEQQI